MKRAACIEFYRVTKTTWRIDGGSSVRGYAWRLRAPNGQIVNTPHESFVSHFNAVRSFRTVANAMDARNVFEVRDADGVTGSHAMLIGK